MQSRAVQVSSLFIFLAFLLDGPGVAQDPAPSQQAASSFLKNVQPFLAQHCIACHNSKLKGAGLSLDSYGHVGSALEDRDVWERVLKKLRAGEMPPEGRPRPTRAELDAALGWIESVLGRQDPGGKPDPGRVTARRLNRVEYNNTIRDLLAIDFRPADDFPADDEGYGFDNIGDVLSLSPVLMEKYLAAAERIAEKAVVVDTVVRPTVERYKAERLKQSGYVRTRHRFPADADYDLRAGLGGIRPDGAPLVTGALLVDGAPVKIFEVNPGRDKARGFEVRASVKEGEHELSVTLLDDSFKSEDFPALDKRDRYLTIDFVEVRGPFNARPRPPTESHKRIFTCGHPNGGHQPECTRKVLGDLARRAYRRPVTEKEIGDLANFIELARREGDSYEQGIRLALQAVLVSPHFLYRLERDPSPNDPLAVHTISEHDLATRLSYFIWSSMPDEELYRIADEKKLRQSGVLEQQVRRMLADAKSKALAENFAGQWLQLRNLKGVKPDPDRFPAFDEPLRSAMLRETELFFETMVREDRSILDFIDAKFTFLNERLARHYGIPGVKGDQFRRVSLDGTQRSGVLTHASILTVSSYPTRTSPVLRGKYLLENFLNAPPPPPPPDVPNLNEQAIGTSGTLRQQLEKHRTNPTCASCHTRMDALGFGLEHYDAIGAWRDRDGQFPIDASGKLPGGRSFRGPRQLKQILKADRDAFSRCVIEKVLTYALGRGLESYDEPAVEWIGRRLARSGYRFSRLVMEIVNSMPFQMRRGEGGKT